MQKTVSRNMLLHITLLLIIIVTGSCKDDIDSSRFNVAQNVYQQQKPVNFFELLMPEEITEGYEVVVKIKPRTYEPVDFRIYYRIFGESSWLTQKMRMVNGHYLAKIPGQFIEEDGLEIYFTYQRPRQNITYFYATDESPALFTVKEFVKKAPKAKVRYVKKGEGEKSVQKIAVKKKRKAHKARRVARRRRARPKKQRRPVEKSTEKTSLDDLPPIEKELDELEKLPEKEEEKKVVQKTKPEPVPEPEKKVKPKPEPKAKPKKKPPAKVVKKLTPKEAALAYLKRKGIPFTINEFIKNASFGRNAIVKKFLIAGMNPNQRNRRGRVALIMAAKNGRNNTVRTLLKYGANINMRDKKGTTALIKTVIKKKYRTMKILMKNGARKDIKDNRGGTAVFYAEQKNLTKALDILLK